MPNINRGAKAWELDLAGRVGEAVQARRKALKRTAVQVAERTKELGYPITRVTITKIENNTRTGKIDVAELLVLAAALELPPAALLFPNALDDVTILPGKPMRGIEAVGWFTGTGTVVPEGVSTNNQRIGLMWQLVQIEQTLEIQRDNLVQQEGGLELLTMSEPMREHYEQQAQHTREAIKSLESRRDRIVHDYRMVTDD